MKRDLGEMNEERSLGERKIIEYESNFMLNDSQSEIVIHIYQPACDSWPGGSLCHIRHTEQ